MAGEGVLQEIVLAVDDARFRAAVLARRRYHMLHNRDDTVTFCRVGAGGRVDRLYTTAIVSRDDRLFGRCECRDWLYRASREGVPCKHLWLAAAELGLVELPAAPG